MPEVASPPAISKRTGWLYQPPQSGPCSGMAALTTGPVSSYLSSYGNGALTFPALSTQIPESDAVALSGPP
jgi:hypothetical protein